MSTFGKRNGIDGSELPASGSVSAAPLPGAGGGDSVRVYEELGRLAEWMPERYRELFCFRWGLCGEFPHITSQVARKFEIPKSTVEHMLNRCLWNIASRAHEHELHAIRGLVGDDPQRWAARAWAQAERRWGHHDCEFSETVLLLAVAGLDVPEAHQAARQHMVDAGLGRGNKWGRPLTAGERADASRRAVDRILVQVIWPSAPVRLCGLDAFGNERPLPAWAAPKTGVFKSEKLDRLVQFDSDLELLMLRQLDADPRVVDYQEQPVTIPYVLDGQAHEYTPDVIVQVDDGRAFVIEAKPPIHLGDFTNWMKWASLAAWCEQAGIGFWIGSPQRSIAEHRCVQPDRERHELVADEVKAGEVAEGDYTALEHLVGYEQLGLIATAELLDWRADLGRVRHAEGPDREQAQQLWALIDQHRDAQLPDSRVRDRAVP